MVLQLRPGEARIELNDVLTVFNVKELDCASSCVSPGHVGTREFQLLAPGVLATLTKRVDCPKDAEVCGGLPAGSAELRISTASGETAVVVWGDYCDM